MAIFKRAIRAKRAIRTPGRRLLAATAGVVVLLFATGCQMNENAQFFERDDGSIYISGRTSAEIKWQYIVTCDRDNVCMSQGLKTADWAVSGEGQRVVDVLVKWFDGQYGNVDIPLNSISYNGEQCLTIPPTRDDVGFTLGAHPDCEFGKSMQ